MNTATNEQLIINQTNQKIKGDEVEVPMLPEVANKVVQLTRNPESEANDLAKLIQSDQALAGHVMRIANSALYSPNASLVSLQQAITRLGMDIISDIALAATLNSKMFNAPGFEQYIQDNLSYSLMTGLWAKEIARICRRNVETAFLAGLLHDMGRSIGIQLVMEISTHVKANVDPRIVLALANHFQRALGIKVVNEWEMPSLVRDVVTWFDDPDSAGSSRDQTLTVIAGSLFASHFSEPTKHRSQLSEEQLKASPSLASLNLYPDDVDALLEKSDLVKAALEAIRQ